MITGDAPETALAISRMLNLSGTRAITGATLDAMTDDELK